MQKISNQLICPLCGGPNNELFHEDSRRPYFRCAECQLVFVSQTDRLPPDEEKMRYDLHENDPNDTGYRAFLNRLCTPMLKKMTPGMRGIDYGCGPGPTLSSMFEAAQFPCAIYDPFYAHDAAVLEKKYEFLSCSEAMEHFYNPLDEFERFLKLVKPGGLIGIMTQLVTEKESFAHWHYITDETHVCFFSEATFRWLAEKYQLKVEFPSKSVILFTR